MNNKKNKKELIRFQIQQIHISFQKFQILYILIYYGLNKNKIFKTMLRISSFRIITFKIIYRKYRIIKNNINKEVKVFNNQTIWLIMILDNGQ